MNGPGLNAGRWPRHTVHFLFLGGEPAIGPVFSGCCGAKLLSVTGTRTRAFVTAVSKHQRRGLDTLGIVFGNLVGGIIRINGCRAALKAFEHLRRTSSAFPTKASGFLSKGFELFVRVAAG